MFFSYFKEALFLQQPIRQIRKSLSYSVKKNIISLLDGDVSCTKERKYQFLKLRRQFLLSQAAHFLGSYKQCA